MLFQSNFMWNIQERKQLLEYKYYIKAQNQGLDVMCFTFNFCLYLQAKS